MKIVALGVALLLMTPGRTAPIQSAPEAHRSDFDYLLGAWQFTARSARWGQYGGYWTAVRLEQGQILDEFRAVGDNGQTVALTTTLRAYDPQREVWDLVSLSHRGGLQDRGTARRAGRDMVIRQTLNWPTPELWRIRYHDIEANRFLWNGDRSTDGGKTWQKDYLVIEARRVGPARAATPLTHDDGRAN